MLEQTDPTKEKEQDDRVVVFTDRQLEVIRAWASTKSSSEAANLLEITDYTFQTHLKRMRNKLGVHRTLDVYLYLQRNDNI